MIDKYTIGQVVFSKAGRDKGRPFIIIGIEDECVYLADGICRLLDKPKLKKAKHIQPTNQNVQWISDKIMLGEQITNANLQTAIKDYLNNTLNKGGL